MRERPWSDARLGDLEEPALMLKALVGQCLHHDFGGLDKALARLFHRHAKAVVLDRGRAATEADDDAAIGQQVEHGNLLSHPHRVMPGQHDDHGTQLDLRGAAGHEGEKLHHVRHHGVRSKVVLHAPDRVEP